MMSFNIGTLSNVNLGLLLEDHEAKFADYLYRKICVVESVDHPEGTMDRWEYPLGMFADGNRDAKHAPGTPTPKGNSAMGTVQYSIDPYSWAESVNHIAKRSLEARGTALDKIAVAAGHMVHGRADKELAGILAGGGAAGTFDNLTQETISTAWDSTGTPRQDIEGVIDALRGADLIGVFGWDVIRALQYNEEFINNADKSAISYEEAIEELYRLGLSEVYVEMNPKQAGAREATRSYGGIYQGVAYIGTKNNLIMAEQNTFGFDSYIHDDTRTEYFRASLDCDFVRGYAEHGFFMSGHLS
jgi:hypothetical protein